jgi:hypothetical protein
MVQMLSFGGLFIESARGFQHWRWRLAPQFDAVRPDRFDGYFINKQLIAYDEFKSASD